MGSIQAKGNSDQAGANPAQLESKRYMSLHSSSVGLKVQYLQYGLVFYTLVFLMVWNQIDAPGRKASAC